MPDDDPAGDPAFGPFDESRARAPSVSPAELGCPVAFETPAVLSRALGVADMSRTVGLPFKIVDQYVMTSAPRGETYYRKYTLDRGGFEGPIQVQLADKQARHLQGVAGPVLTLKQGETEFEYPAFLPPWMELGRTCRVCVMSERRAGAARLSRGGE